MKFKLLSLILVMLFCVGLVACSAKPMRPIDYPNTTWQCDDGNIKFSVSKDGKITNATMLNKNGESVSISLIFTDISEGMVSITDADETETYISGTCTYGDDMFSIFITDIYNSELGISATRLTFNRK